MYIEDTPEVVPEGELPYIAQLPPGIINLNRLISEQ